MFTLPESAQEVFDKVANHLLTQNKRCGHFLNPISQERFACRYRLNGMSCAAGCLIPDEFYNEELMEGHDWVFLCDKMIVPNDHEDFINQLQYLHDDRNICVSKWRDRLIDLAHQHGLSVENLPKKV